MHHIREMFTTGFVSALVDGAMSVLLVILMFLYSPRLAFIVVGFVLLFLLLRLHLERIADIAKTKTEENLETDGADTPSTNDFKICRQ